jgi:hypothetical protein
MPEKNKSVEYKATLMEGHRDEFVIESVGKFVGYYVDEDGKEYKGMHIFVSDRSGGWLTGDVQFWREVRDDCRVAYTKTTPHAAGDSAVSPQVRLLPVHPRAGRQDWQVDDTVRPIHERAGQAWRR